MPEALYAIALLACPLVMGAMMWFMMRGRKDQPVKDDVAAKRAELVGLQAQVDQLQAERDNTRDRVGGSPL